MNLRLRPQVSLCWVALAAAGAVFIACTGVRLQRLAHVAALPGWSVAAPADDATSPTGFAHGQRQLPGPDRRSESAVALAQTETALATGAWRDRTVSFDNAPVGRESRLPWLFRGWLALVAWCDRALTGREAGVAAADAARLAGPLWQGLVLLVATALVARRVGGGAAALVAAALVALFPLAGALPPGTPEPRGFAVGWALLGLVPLVAGAPTRRAWALAGAAGAAGLSLDLAGLAPVLAGVALGSGLARRAAPDAARALPWGTWALGGAVTSLGLWAPGAWPDRLGLHLETLHPLHALTWLGVGGVLHGWAGGRAVGGRGLLGVALAGLAALAAPLAHVLIGARSPWSLDPGAAQLTPLGGGVTALALGVAAVPLLAAAVAAGVAWRPAAAARRAGLLVAGGATVAALAAALGQARAWGVLDAAAVAWAVAAWPAGHARRVWAWAAVAALALAPGLMVLWPRGVADARRALAPAEVESLVARDLAHWLAARAGAAPVTVWAPPATTTALVHFGGFRGVASLAWENEAGLAAALRLARTPGRTEALALLQARGVTHVVLPSWDRFLDDFALAPGAGAERSLLGALRGWAPPAWLQPLAYPLPAIPGFEGQEVAVLAVGDEVEPAHAAARLAEFFAETGRAGRAAEAAEELRKYPADLGALAARAQVAAALRRPEEFTRLVGALVAALARGEDRYLPWDRRASLLAVLMQARRRDLAATQWEQLLEEMDAGQLRGLSPTALARLRAISRLLGREIPDPALRTLVRDLLPPERAGE